MVLESLLRTYEDQRLLDEAVQHYVAEARADRPNRQEQLAAVEAEIRKADEALDRYFNAFETGSMSEEMCRPRIERLAERLRGLRARKAELEAAIEDEQLTGPDPEQVEDLKGRIREALLDAAAERRKAILQELVAEVRGRAEAASGQRSACRWGFVQCPKWCTIWDSSRTPPRGSRKVGQMTLRLSIRTSTTNCCSTRRRSYRCRRASASARCRRPDPHGLHDALPRLPKGRVERLDRGVTHTEVARMVNVHC